MIGREIKHEEDVRHRLEKYHLYWIGAMLAESPNYADQVRYLHTKSHDLSSQ